MTEAMLERYLERIGCKVDARPSADDLFALQRAHLLSIPYENLDIFYGNGTVTVLDEESLFNKMVNGPRGGYCFELNGLFACLLRALSYDVTEFFGRWHRGESDPYPMRRHRVMKVVLDGESYLVDAGVGSACPLAPLYFRENIIQERNGANYRIVRDPVLGFAVQFETAAGFSNFYSFSEDPHLPQDFVYAHYYCSTFPDSPFRKHLFAHRYTEHGRNSIMDEPNEDGTFRQVLRVAIPGGMEEMVITGELELQDALRRHFGIQLPRKV